MLLIICILPLISGFVSCRKFLEVDAPATSTNGRNVFNSDATATAVLTGIYAKISSSGVRGGLNAISVCSGLSADELTLFGGAANTATDYIPYYTNGLSNSNTTINFFSAIYPIIFTTNSAIEGLTQSIGVSKPVKQQLLGEARFMRAFCYFYLVNLFGDVPLALTTDYKTNSTLIRKTKSDVYQQIKNDLIEAKSLLGSDFVGANSVTPTNERVRPTKWAATALLARVYLYTREWTNAETEASAVIANTSLFSLANLDDVFIANSRETIWQLQPVIEGENTPEARIFILPPTGPTGDMQFPVYLSSDLVNNFEADDQRKNKWVGSVVANNITYHYPYKYKVTFGASALLEYSTVLRLAELYLIRSEARAQQNNLPSAATDLNTIRNRASLGNIAAGSQSGLLAAIQQERQVELFTEWGHRWLDLKRNGNIDAVMETAASRKGGTWNTNWQWYPLSLTELQRNPKLTQNTGY